MKDRFDNELGRLVDEMRTWESSLSNLQADLESNVAPSIPHEKEI